MGTKLLLTDVWTTTVTAPDAAFSFVPFTIKKHATRREFRASNFDLQAYAGITPVATYYVKPAAEGGSDSANGLTEATAFASINKGLNIASAHRVYVKAGTYYTQAYPKSQSWNNVATAQNIEVIGYGGQVISTVAVNPALFTWSLVDNHYEASHAYTFDRILDAKFHDSNDDFPELTKVTSIAEVDATANTWWYDATEDIVYVRTQDDRAPDADIWCMMSIPNGRMNDDGITYYIEGIDFYGGSNCFGSNPDTGETNKLLFKNCKFKYSNGDGVAFGKGFIVIMQNCEVARSNQDGFKCDTTGTPANFIMINCIGRDNGYYGATENLNGYSRHGPGNTVAINTSFIGNRGPGCRDITSSNYWMLGCTTGPQIISTVGFSIGELNEGSKAWLDTCTSADSVHISADGGCFAYYKDFDPASPTTGGAGTVTTY